MDHAHCALGIVRESLGDEYLVCLVRDIAKLHLGTSWSASGVNGAGSKLLHGDNVQKIHLFGWDVEQSSCGVSHFSPLICSERPEALLPPGGTL